MAEEENGIRGIKKLEFDFEFEYSKGGDTDIGNTLILRAPSYAQSKIKNRLRSAITKAMMRADSFVGGDNERTPQKNSDESKADAAKQMEKQSLLIMAAGMDDDKFDEFISYIKKSLTGNKHLAHIDGEDIPLTDHLWNEIEEKGGDEAIDRILSAFIGFFTSSILRQISSGDT